MKQVLSRRHRHYFCLTIFLLVGLVCLADFSLHAPEMESFSLGEIRYLLLGLFFLGLMWAKLKSGVPEETAE